MKRILSILLVAMLLVSALPLGASAAIFGALEDQVTVNNEPDTDTTIQDGASTSSVIEGAKEPEIMPFSSVIEPENSAIPNIVTVELHIYENGALTKAIGPKDVKLDSDESYVTAHSLMTDCFGSEYSTLTIRELYIMNGDTAEKINNDTTLYPENIRAPKVIRIIANKVAPVTVYIKWNNRTEGPAKIDVPNKTSISIPDLLNAASKHEKFQGLNISFEGYEYTIDKKLTNETSAKPGETVVYMLKGAISNATGTVGGVPGYTIGGNSGNGDLILDTTPDTNVSTKATAIFYIDNDPTTKYATLDAEGITVAELLDAAASSFGYTQAAFRNMFVEAYKGSTQLFLNQGRVFNGETVRIYLKTPTTSGNGTGSNGTVDGDDLYMGYSGTTNKDPRPVMLYVFTKNSGNGITYSADFNITSLASDDKTSLTEIRNFLKNYYNATNSDGIIADGIYEYVYNFNSSWANDTNKYENIYNLNKARNDGRVELAVVLYNAKLKSASVADSSNPKTGDAIFAPIAVLGVSTVALATAMFVWNKKRVAR